MNIKESKPLNENQWFVNIILVTIVFIPIFLNIFIVLGLIIYLAKLNQTRLIEENSFFLMIYSWINIIFSLALAIVTYLVFGLHFEPTYILTTMYPIVSIILLTISMKYRRQFKAS